MSGFDVEKARTVLRVPAGFAVEIAIAVGRNSDGAHLRLLALRPLSGSRNCSCAIAVRLRAPWRTR